MYLRDLSNPTMLKARYEVGTAEHWVSAPGIGKSTLARELPVILSKVYGETFGYHEETTTTIEAPDVRGFLVPSKDEQGRGISYFTRPGILPTREYLEAHPRGIYFIDERSQSNLDVQKALAPVVLDKKFGSEYLPDGWMVVSASNRMEDKSGVVKPPMHLINRERQIDVEYDLQSAALWWEANNMHPIGVAFIKHRPGVFADHVPAKPVPFCTPRSYTKAMHLLACLAGTDDQGNPSMDLPSDGVTQQLLAGEIGEGVAAELTSYAKLKEHVPTVDEILKDPKGCKCPDRLDAAYMAVQLCIHYADNKTVNSLWTYVERLPVELQTSAAKSLLDKAGGILLNSQALSNWISNNKALVITTNS